MKPTRIKRTIIVIVAIIIAVLLMVCYPHEAAAIGQAVLLWLYNNLVSVTLFTLVGIALRFLSYRKQKIKERKKVRSDFCSLFEEAKEVFEMAEKASLDSKQQLPVEPKLLVAKDMDAPRESMPKVRKKIKDHLKWKRKFHIFNIYAGATQGRSVFLWRLMRDLIEDKGIGKYQTEFWHLRKDRFDSRDDWENFVSVTERFVNINKKKNLFLFLDDPFGKISSDAKKKLLLFNIDVLWERLEAKFGRCSRLIIVATSSSSGEEKRYITYIPLSFTQSDMKEVVFSHAKLRGWKFRDAQKFLDQPGILRKCRRNLLFLLYLFEKHIRGKNLRFMLDDQSRESLETYFKLSEDDVKRQTVRFTAFANLIRLSVPGFVFEEIDRTALKDMRTEFLNQDVEQNWRIKVRFLGYVLLQEEVETKRDFYKDISEYFIEFLNPWVESLCRSLEAGSDRISLQASMFLRSLLHFIVEEQYRPILTFSGYNIAKSLFERHKDQILDFVSNRLLPKIKEDPSLTLDIHRWASTLVKFRLSKEAGSLYNKTSELLPALEPETKVKVMIPLAMGLARFPSREMRREAIKIYQNLLFGSEYAENKQIDRGKILTSAVDIMEAKKAMQWMDKLRKDIHWDTLLWLKKGQIMEKLGDLVKAEHSYSEAVKQGKRMAFINDKAYMNALLRYSVFLIRYGDYLSLSDDRPGVEDLLEKAEKIALSLKENVGGIYQARGEFFEKRKKDYASALEEYRKAANWCQKNVTPNSRPYNKIANFLLENAMELSKATGQPPQQYLAEAESWLRVVTEGGDFDRYSKRHAFNILGRLVGGTVKKIKEIYPYWYGQTQRLNYDEALKFLEESFESDENSRFDSNLKTWQDIMTHGPVKDVLIKKAEEIPDLGKKCICLREAQKHFKAIFESLPREEDSLDTRKVKEHVVVAMDAYADFLWERLGKEGCLDGDESRKEAERYYEEAIKKMEEWKLNSPSFESAYKVYEYYVRFLLGTEKVPRIKIPSKKIQVVVPQIPLKPYAKDALLKIITCHERALQVLSPRREEYNKEFEQTTIGLLSVLRTFVRNSWYYEDNKDSAGWVEKYSTVADHSLKKSKETGVKATSITAEIIRFLKDPQLKKFWKNNKHLQKKLERLCLIYNSSEL